MYWNTTKSTGVRKTPNTVPASIPKTAAKPIE